VPNTARNDPFNLNEHVLRIMAVTIILATLRTQVIVDTVAALVPYALDRAARTTVACHSIMADRRH